MVHYHSLQSLLTEEDLPETDNTPVDNELQILIPTLLRAILSLLWAERQDWFFGVNLGLYYDPDEPAIGPDGFLSLGVQRLRPNGKLRLSYVVAQENQVVPQWVVEVVSKTPGGEYAEKLTKYAKIGVLYYTIYNPDYYQRDEHEPFEVYRLEQGSYVRLYGNPVWLREIGLGIGYKQGYHEGYTREWLYWYDIQGKRYPSPENVIAQERQRAEQAEERAEQERRLREELLNKLRERGINPDEL